MRRHLPLVTVVTAVPSVLVVSVLMATVAWAYFTSGTTGSGLAPVGVLAAPSAAAGSPTGAVVAVTWSGVPAPGPGPVGYYVTRSAVPGDGAVDVCGSPASPLPDSPTSCVDSPVRAGTYTYAVSAVYRTWTATGAPSDPVVVGQVASATSLTVSPSTATYGSEDTVTFGVAVSTGVALAPSGTVTVAAAGVDLCTITLPDAECTTDATALAASGIPYPVTATYAGDGEYTGSTSGAQELTVVDGPPPEDPNPPTIVTTSLADATATQLGYDQQLALDPAAPSVTWSVVSGALPLGLSLDPGTGEVSGDVDPAAVTGTVTVQALDLAGGSDRVTLTLTVDAPPVITTGSLAAARTGETNYSQTLTAAGGAPGLSWDVNVGTLPSGLAYDQGTGVISGNVDPVAVSQTFTVTVTDANGVSDSAELTIAVTRELVQQRTVPMASGNHSTFTVTTINPVAAGNTLVVSLAQPCATSVGTPVASAVTGATWDGSAFTRAVGTGCSADGDAELWYLAGTGSASGTSATTVTVTLATAASVPFLDVAEYSGVTGFDAAPGAGAGASATTASVGPGSSTPSVAGELVVTCAFVSRTTLGTLSAQLVPFLLLNQASPDEGFGAYLVEPGTVPHTFTYAQSGAGAWSAVIGAFHLAP